MNDGSTLQVTNNRRDHGRTRAKSYGVAAILLCSVLLLTGCAGMGERMALPGTGHGSPAGKLPPSPDYELWSLRTADGTRIVVQFGKALDEEGQPLTDPEHRPTVIYFYPRAMCLADPATQKLFQYFRRMGVNVLIPDYPGYGMSEGRATEKGCYAAADAAYARLVERGGRDHPPIIVAGWSLGSGTAVDLASRRCVSGLITIGAFTSIRDMGPIMVPWPMRWLVPELTARCRFDNLAKIPAVTCPILIVQGTKDDFVPNRMGDQLAAAARTKVTRLPVERAHHADIWDVGGKALWQAIADWLHSAAAPKPESARSALDGGGPLQLSAGRETPAPYLAASSLSNRPSFPPAWSTQSVGGKA